jgi:hypothetical protein
VSPTPDQPGPANFGRDEERTFAISRSGDTEMEGGGDQDGNNSNQEQRGIKLSSSRFNGLFGESDTTSKKAPANKRLLSPVSIHEKEGPTCRGQGGCYSKSIQPRRIERLPIRI